ncbi:hypothetical protein INT43_002788 [Umbelopsis isabellina]|uniref:Uncharacterized protein n=1 Tax=Mortierella isabellina TaxID=91625 RepID=A0A8H7UKC8_MORIS|nr:hypothetical protein INT43_002788 [Umbelopsis isabellina]
MVKTLVITILATCAASAYSATIPNPHWLCSCFQPSYDYGCCNKLGGTWDGVDACDLDYTDKNHNDYTSCCQSIGGKETKCKTIHTSDL